MTKNHSTTPLRQHMMERVYESRKLPLILSIEEVTCSTRMTMRPLSMSLTLCNALRSFRTLFGVDGLPNLRVPLYFMHLS